MFRAAYREEIDPHNTIARDYRGEPEDVDMIDNEVVGADAYRHQVCNLMAGRHKFRSAKNVRFFLKHEFNAAKLPCVVTC